MSPSSTRVTGDAAVQQAILNGAAQVELTSITVAATDAAFNIAARRAVRLLGDDVDDPALSAFAI